MKRKMTRKIINLSERQIKYMELESEKSCTCQTEIIRRLLDKAIDQYEKDNNVKL